jgi:hypothetical protein
VASLVGKAIDLVFDAWAVARSDAFDHAGEHRASIETSADDVVRVRIGMCDPARHLARVHRCVAHEAEHRHRIEIARLLFQPGEIDRATVDARWRSGLESPLRQLQLLQPRRQAGRRRIAGAAGAVFLQPDMDPAIEEGAGREHDCPSTKAYAHLRYGADNSVAFEHEVIHRLLEQPQIRLVLQPPPDRRLVQNPIRLRPCRAHGRALARVEDAELDPGFVGRQRHRTAERIDFPDQVPLADATDTGIATHLPQRLNIVSEQ